VALFLQRRERGDKGRDYLAYGCVCREPDCHDRWPFHSADTDTSSSPAPYFCISVGAVGGEPPHLEEYPRPRLGRD
jgi:hypothetical protein